MDLAILTLASLLLGAPLFYGLAPQRDEQLAEQISKGGR